MRDDLTGALDVLAELLHVAFQLGSAVLEPGDHLKTNKMAALGWMSLQQSIIPLGSGCGSVGRAVASDTRDPRFEFRHQQNFICQLYKSKDKNIKKRPGIAQLNLEKFSGSQKRIGQNYIIIFAI